MGLAKLLLATLLLVAVGVGVGFVAPEASGAIYPQRSIARVKLGMSPAQVKARLGRPALKIRKASYTTFYYLGLIVTFRRGGRVVAIETTRSTERTRSGVGVGSTERRVRRGVRGVSCGPHLIVMRLCRVGSGLAGTKATDFLLYRGKVRRVTLSKLTENPSGHDTPPTRPGNLTVVGKTKTTISVSWDASTDDGGILAYFVYKNGLLAGGTTKTRRTFAGLACAVPYAIEVEAMDRAGNRSPRARVSAVTADCPAFGDVYISPTGSDANPCTGAAPCETFDRAYRAANPGDVIDVAPGSYPAQVIYRSAKPSADDITFRAVGDGDVVLTGGLTVHASNVEIRGISAPRLRVSPNPLNTPLVPTDVTLRDMRASGFDIMSSSNVSVIGGDFGPAKDYGSHVKSCASCRQGSRNILIEGVRIHDVVKATPGAHVDCLHVWNTDTIVIQSSQFWNCEHFNILFTWTAAHTGDTPTNITIQNNFFDCCRSGYYSVQLGGGHRELYRNVLIQNNSSNRNFSIGADTTDSRSNIEFFANIAPSLPFGHCGRPGVVFDYNVWASGRPCGKNDIIAASGFRDPANFDFHLADGAPAIGRGHPSRYPPNDIDANSRPAGGAPDAGAHEHS